MTNSSPKFKQLIKHPGAVTLIITVVLLVLSTLIIIFAANFGMLQEKSTANITRNNEAYNAAEAGLEFGINYLKDNSTIIIATAASGFIPPYSDANTTNVTLSNGSKFTVVYTNPVANNFNLIKVTSTGTNSEGSSTRVVSQLMQFGSVLFSPPSIPIVSQGTINVTGNSTITNTYSPTTIQAAGAVNLTGNAKTVVSSGTSSTSSVHGADIQSNNTALGNLSQSDFFATYFNSSSTNVRSQMENVYTNNTSTNYSSTLNGKTGTTIWIDQTAGTATINGNTTIGSASDPVLLIVNGSLSVSGNLTVYGYIFVFGDNVLDTFTGNVNITGGIASAVNISMLGNISVTYNPTVINTLQNLPSIKYYAKVPGTWKDF